MKSGSRGPLSCGIGQSSSEGMKSMARWSWKPMDETDGVLAHMSIAEHCEMAMRQLWAVEGAQY